MAGVKISNLPLSTVPLTGAEVLPIVQGAVTDQVTVANLTAGRAVSALSLSLTTALPIASGGTNSTATPTAGGAGYGTGTAHAYTAAGTAGQVLTSQGASAPTWAASGAQDYIVQSYGII